jgi:hypothetical protein
MLWSRFDSPFVQKTVAAAAAAAVVVVHPEEAWAYSQPVLHGVPFPVEAFQKILDVPVEEAFHTVHYCTDRAVAVVAIDLVDHTVKPNTNRVVPVKNRELVHL